MTDVRELRLVLTVPDFDATLRLYRDALGLDVERPWPAGLRLSSSIGHRSRLAWCLS